MNGEAGGSPTALCEGIPPAGPASSSTTQKGPDANGGMPDARVRELESAAAQARARVVMLESELLVAKQAAADAELALVTATHERLSRESYLQLVTATQHTPCRLGPLFAAQQRLAYALGSHKSTNASPVALMDADTAESVGIECLARHGPDVSGEWHLRDTLREARHIDTIWDGCKPQFAYEWAQSRPSSGFVGFQIPLPGVRGVVERGGRQHRTTGITKAYRVEGTIGDALGATQISWKVMSIGTPAAGEDSLVFCRGTLSKNSAGNLCVINGVYSSVGFGLDDLGTFAGERVGDRAAIDTPSVAEIASAYSEDSDDGWSSASDEGAQVWACAACTFHNAAMGATECEICATPRPD